MNRYTSCTCSAAGAAARLIYINVARGKDLSVPSGLFLGNSRRLA